MQIKNAVSMIPYGLLSGIVDGQEVRITQLGENGFVFRMANQAEKIHEIWLQFFSQNGGCYKKLLIPADRMKKMEESRFFTEYTVLTEDKDYQKYVRQLLADYWKYISLKMTGEDGEVAAAYTDYYPVHLDEDYAESLEEQKEEWFQEAAEKAKGQKLCENVELALELDTPQLYEAWLREPMETFAEKYWKKWGLQEHPIAKKPVERVYIGNTFCPHLFPENDILHAMLEKAKIEGISVTLTFSWIKESQIDSIRELLKFLEQRKEYMPNEIAVNDWGTAHLIRKWKQETQNCVKLNLGILLNRYKKDNRSRYLKEETKCFQETNFAHLIRKWKQETQNCVKLNLGILLNRYKKDNRSRYLKEETKCFQETNLNSEFYQQYLKENQIERYELEACGHEIVIPKGKHSLHLPFFQTNTAQFCTLYAKCACGDRGRQKSVEQCPGYCRGLVFLYPRHLEMFGKYNTLFGYDRTSLEEMEYLNQSVRQGIDRIVVNLL